MIWYGAEPERNDMSIGIDSIRYGYGYGIKGRPDPIRLGPARKHLIKGQRRTRFVIVEEKLEKGRLRFGV
jgi:hypothetical protein